MAIKVSQTYVVHGSRDLVKESLTDPEVLKFCIPKCRSCRKLSTSTMRVSAQVDILTKSYLMDGVVEFKPLEADDGFHVQCNISTGVYKLGRIEGDVFMADEGDDTNVRSEISIIPGRKFNPVLERLAEPLARSLSGAFFKRFGMAVAEKL